MLIVLSGIFLFYNFRIEFWYAYALINFFIIWAIAAIVYKFETRVVKEGESSIPNSSLIKIVRYWYGAAAILYIFKQVYIIGYTLKPADWDLVYIKLDFVIFGLNPTQWIYKYNNPFLTEFLQIVYVYYYPMIVVFGLELYLRHRYTEFKYTIFVLFLSFFTSYLLYLIFPANGPRFHLHDFYSISNELPGILLTEPIRAFLNFGESIPRGVQNPQDYVQRDAMPSLHTITAFLIMYLSWKFKSKSFYFYLPYFFCMVLATVYLRYHYVVDIIGGLILCVFTIIAGIAVYWKKQKLPVKFN
ncbi:MAG: phosphatase PAP2 family protein [Ignavibacteria bacterium]|nr:phosphatase PAP2 family protein [Ignavibacteria bacterium]